MYYHSAGFASRNHSAMDGEKQNKTTKKRKNTLINLVPLIQEGVIESTSYTTVRSRVFVYGSFESIRPLYAFLSMYQMKGVHLDRRGVASLGISALLILLERVTIV